MSARLSSMNSANSACGIIFPSSPRHLSHCGVRRNSICARKSPQPAPFLPWPLSTATTDGFCGSRSQ